MLALRPAAVLLAETVVAAALLVFQLVAAAALQMLQLVAAASRVIPAFGGRRGLPLQQRQSCWKNVNLP